MRRVIDGKGNRGRDGDGSRRGRLDQASGRFEMKRRYRNDVMAAAEAVVAERLITGIILGRLCRRYAYVRNVAGVHFGSRNEKQKDSDDSEQRDSRHGQFHCPIIRSGYRDFGTPGRWSVA